jgi:purine-binding chemotaxis protein CheW
MMLPEALSEAEEARLRQLANRIDAEVHTVVEEVVLVDEAVQETAVSADIWLETGIPKWAEKDFEVLLFKIGGIRLGLPLIHLGSIHPLDTVNVNELPGQSNCFMGSVRVLGQQFSLVDSAQLVMPERCKSDEARPYKYIVTLAQSHWALAVEQLDDAIRFNAADVHWRSERSKRAWLAGTIKAHMCALMEPLALMKLLEDIS